MDLNKSKVIRLGIIGCGWIMKKVHIPVFADIPHVRISAIYDKSIEELKQFTGSLKDVRLYCDLNEFFSEKLDAVIIGTPNSLHSYYTQEALSRGIHVLCEKPVGLSASEIKQMIEMSKRRKVIYLPAYVNRYRKDINIVYENIRNGRIGEIRSIDAKWIRSNGIPRAGGWNTNRAMAGGGVLQDLGSHMIDLCTYFAECDIMSDCKATFAVAEHSEQKSALWLNKANDYCDFDVETSVKAEIYLENGIQVKMYLDWAAEKEGDYTDFCITGTKGTIRLHTLFGFSNNYPEAKRKTIVLETDESTTELDVDNVSQMEAFSRQAHYFIDCIDNGDYINMNCDCAYPTVNIIEKLYKCR